MAEIVGRDRVADRVTEFAVTDQRELDRMTAPAQFSDRLEHEKVPLLRR